MRPIGRVKLLLGAVAVAFFVAISIARYHLYVHAVAWHCLHGDHAQVAGHTVTLPQLWWEEKDPSHWDTYLFKRACTGMSCLQPKITVSHVIPAFQSTVENSDQETLDSVRRLVSTLNARSNHNSQLSSIASLFTIKAKRITLYCVKQEASVTGLVLPATNVCRAPRIPYSIYFLATAQQQEEDKSILSTLK